MKSGNVHMDKNWGTPVQPATNGGIYAILFARKKKKTEIPHVFFRIRPSEKLGCETWYHKFYMFYKGNVQQPD